jgi:hypothetical protein
MGNPENDQDPSDRPLSIHRYSILQRDLDSVASRDRSGAASSRQMTAMTVYLISGFKN